MFLHLSGEDEFETEALGIVTVFIQGADYQDNPKE